MQTLSVLELLPTLPHSDLNKINNALKYLLHNTQPEPNNNETYFYKLLEQHLQKQGINCPPLSQFRKTRYYKQMTEGMGSLDGYIDDNWGNIKRVERMKLYDIAIKLIIQKIKKQNYPLSVGTLSSYLQYVPQLIDNAFPDYLACGLQHFILHK